MPPVDDDLFKSLDRLISGGLLSGYLLVSGGKGCEPAAGRLGTYSGQDAIPECLASFLKPFLSLDSPTESFTVWGHKLITIHQTESSIYAISHRRQLGIGVCQLSFGFLFVSFERPAHPRHVISEVEKLFRQAERN